MTLQMGIGNKKKNKQKRIKIGSDCLEKNQRESTGRGYESDLITAVDEQDGHGQTRRTKMPKK